MSEQEPSYTHMLRPETRERLAAARKEQLAAARNAWRHIQALVSPAAWPQVAEAVISIANERRRHDTLSLCADLATLNVSYRLWGRYIELRDAYERGEMG